MRKYLFVILSFIVAGLSSCSNSMSQELKTDLAPAEFDAKLKAMPGGQLVDVRTKKEFAGGYITDAMNMDWSSSEFDNMVLGLDKDKPVFIYCLSGARSASAAKKFRRNGFKEVYELNGGILKWRAEGFPEVTMGAPVSGGMTRTEFEAMFNTDKMVLVDFYADWCAPCRRMKPFLDEIAKENGERLVIVRINADTNQQLVKELKVDALPYLHLYKNKGLTWTHTGFIDKEGILKALE